MQVNKRYQNGSAHPPAAVATTSQWPIGALVGPNHTPNHALHPPPVALLAGMPQHPPGHPYGFQNASHYAAPLFYGPGMPPLSAQPGAAAVGTLPGGPGAGGGAHAQMHGKGQHGWYAGAGGPPHPGAPGMAPMPGQPRHGAPASARQPSLEASTATSTVSSVTKTTWSQFQRCTFHLTHFEQLCSCGAGTVYTYVSVGRCHSGGC